MKTLAEITLCKARSGRYQDTPENRRLHRVGQQYGGQKTKEEELKEFAYTIKQVPDERHFEEMSDAELKRFRVFAYKCSIDFENLNKLTRQRCKQWADIAGTEIGSRNREGRKKEDSTEVAAKNKVKTEISSKREKYNKMLAGLDQFISKLEDRFEKLSESSNDEIADEAMDIVDAIYEWRDHYGSGDALTINDSEDEYFESDAREAVEDFIEIVSNEFSNKVKFDPKAFFNKFGLQWSNNVEKSRSGVYINNAENRAKHRVGQHYGSEKEVVAGADDATYPGVPDASPKNKREERLQRLENYKKAKATLEEWLQSDKMSEEVKAQMRVKLEKINQRIPALEKRLGIKSSEPIPATPATPEPAPQPAPEQQAEPEAPKDSLEAKLNDLFMRGEEEAFIKLYHQNYPDKVAMQEIARREAEHAESILPASIANMKRDMSDAEIDAVIREYLRLDPARANKTDDDLKWAVWDFHKKRDGHYGLSAQDIKAKLIEDNKRRAYQLRHEAGKRLFKEYLTSPEGQAQVAKVKEERDKILLENENAVATAKASFEDIIKGLTASKFNVIRFDGRQIYFNLVGEGNNEREISITNYEK